MKIEERLNTSNFASELPNVDTILAEAEVTVSFWGNRIVTVKGYEGSISLSELTSKVVKAGEQRCNADDLTTRERVAGMDISNRLSSFYETTDIQIKKVHWFTRLLNWIREHSILPFTPRDGLIGPEKYFQAYSEERYVKEFGNIKKGDFSSYSDSNGGLGYFGYSSSYGPINRIIAREEDIRSKLNS